MAENPIVERANWADAATLQPERGGAFVATLPFGHALTDDMSEQARFASSSPADTQIHLDFGQTQLVGQISILVHDFSQEATLRVVLSENADRSSPGLDRTFDLWHEVEAAGVQPYAQARYGGLLAPEEVAQFKPRSFLWWKPGMLARYCSLYFDDHERADGPSFARLLIGPAFQTAKPMGRQWGIETIDPRENRGRSRGRTRKLRGEASYRQLNMHFPHVPEGEALTFWQRYDREQPDGCVLVIPFPDRPEILHEVAVYGEIASARRNDSSGYRRFRRDLTVNEVT